MFQICCRLCLEQVHLNKMQSLYGRYEDFTIRDKIYELFHIKFSDTEKLSSICDECMKKIRMVDNIRNSFLEADRKFQLLLTENLEEESCCKVETDENHVDTQDNTCFKSTTERAGSIVPDCTDESNSGQKQSVMVQGQNSTNHNFEQPPTAQHVEMFSNEHESDALIETLETPSEDLSDSEVTVYEEEMLSELSTTYEKENRIDNYDESDNLIYTSDQSCDVIELEESKFVELMNDEAIFDKTVETDNNQTAFLEAEQGETVSSEHQCNLCNETFDDSDNLIHHQNSVHQNAESHSCKQCFQLFESNNELKMHDCIEKSHIYRCLFCSECFGTVKDLRSHTQSSHGSYTNGNVTIRKTDLYRCALCTDVFRNNKELIEHGHSTHPDGFILHRCERCDKTFGNIKILQAHLTAHEKNYECSYCGKVCPNSVSLAGHENTHTKEQPFQCTQCGRSFAQYTSMRRHMKIHYNEKAYQCEFCPKRFRQRSVMLTHKRIHTGEKPFSCVICSRTFRDHSTLAKHKKVHEKHDKREK
ncbi:zinc finger protein ZFP2-like [Toxorhynchites rutilus septentrionalis]|uniref:zinc finger protein ZFP2-like n=1 Tax=Toxorhynchites rutilus septentrionalis TaxID=329112 RepID=UPI00247A29FD|nr:zinc finger protein ZFP2-like [Toxorhynchites rutilus septentrionalis]